MPRISVLMPAYNVERYVWEALASVQNQTIQDIEIIVVDDNSTDSTLRIVEKIARSDARIRVNSTDRNLGPGSARNVGLSLCRAPFIACMDADDIAVPERLEKQLAFLEANPNIALVGCTTITIAESGEPTGISRVPLSCEEISKTLLIASPCYHIWLARREVYDELGGYRAMAFGEDYDFLLRAVTAGYFLGNLSEPLMKVRIRNGSTAHVGALKHRKAHRYVTHLYRERLALGRDHFSVEDYERALQEGRLEGSVHGLAVSFSRRAVVARSLVARYGLMALSALVSPWQARYFIDRLRLRLALRK